MAGKLAATIDIVNVADGSAGVRALLPQPLMIATASASAASIGARASAPRARRGITPKSLRLPLTIAPPYQRCSSAGTGGTAAAGPSCRPSQWRATRASRNILRRRSSPEGGVCRDGSQRSRTGPVPNQEPARGGRGHDDPHGSDALLRDSPALPLRRRVRLPVPVHAAARLVPAARLDRGHLLRRSRAPGR